LIWQDNDFSNFERALVKLPKPFLIKDLWRPMQLKNLFVDLPFPIPGDIPDVEINGISIDSRFIRPGHLFVAMKGGSVDGHNYIQKALENGAVAIVGDIGRFFSPAYIGLENPRQALTYLAAAFYGFPARKLTVIGVTGTDGKTTTSNLIYKILAASGIRVGMISTVNAVIGDEVLDTGFHVTTPDAHDVQRYLTKMVDSGLTHVVLETTSHGWAQYRVDACEFDIGVVTNITHEHFDEHGSYENYRAAKARLFGSLERTKVKPQGNPRLAVINRDDQSFEFLNEFVKTKKINYGLAGIANVRAEDVKYSSSGIEFNAVSNDFRVGVRSRLVGAYNVSNCLAALTAAVYGLGVVPDDAGRGISTLEGIPGRMEQIDMGQDFIAIVDFAHTPNALKVTLEAGRKMTKGRVISVFGSAGLRDKEKRRMMAEVSAELADLSILTAEDPRTESLDGILDEMAAGARSKGGREGETFWRVPDRGEAIKFAIGLAKEGDIVLSCGKGHEQSMCFGKKEYLWDDRTAMRAALSELLGIEGGKMPYLPSLNKKETDWLAG
jgi:UDP-N-acetylmuramoyl-L-alanyl-D-glutamate--2,6-diaminopimelate ligase